MTHRRRGTTFLVACSVAALWLAGQAAGEAAAQTFTNPVVPRGGDPWAVQWKGQYFYTSTTGGDVRLARSPWLQSLNSNSVTVWKPPGGTAYSSEIWAPELHRLNDKWYLYVAADDGNDANHRMYVLEGTSDDPQGSYALKGQISIPSNRWAIDGTVMEYGDKDYLVWSGRTYSTDLNSSQSLYIAQMSNPWTLTGNRTQISSPTYSWETHGHPVNEGPEVLQHGNDLFLTYSASAFETPYYAVGALKLTGTDPLSAGSWTKLPQPLFQQGNGVEGPGHASFVKSPDGSQDWIVYHARTDATAPRDVRIQPFTWAADGTPVFGSPIPTGQPIAQPAGVPLVTFVPNESFERGGAGWLGNFHVFGDAGAVDNNASHFESIAGGDGTRVGYLGVGAHDSGLYQDVGPIHAGKYTLGVALAISADEADAARAQPATFVLQLKGVGRFPGGSADEAEQVTLGQLTIDSAELQVSSFRSFSLPVDITDASLVGDWLRVELVSPAAGGAAGAAWDVKLDRMTLDYAAPAAPSSDVPEPGAAAATLLAAGASGLLRRRKRDNKTMPSRLSPRQLLQAERRANLRNGAPQAAQKGACFRPEMTQDRSSRRHGVPAEVGTSRVISIGEERTRMSGHRVHWMSAAVALAAGALAGTAQAGTSLYQSTVLSDNPYLYYRFNDPAVAGSLTNQPVDDISTNNNDGIYRGNPVAGVAGQGTASDNAVSFPGTSNTGLDYARTTNNRTFGSQVGQSSYELIFKSNIPNSADTAYQAIFGVFNAPDTTVVPNRTNTGAVAIEFNSNSTGNPLPGTSRFYTRDEDGIALGGTISNGSLLDGNYHHLVFTYDNTAAADSYIQAYVDGVSVPVTDVYQGGGSAGNVPDNFLDFTVDPTFGARNVRGTVGAESNVTIDEAALYTRVLTPADVSAHVAAAGISVPEPTSLGLLAIGGLGLLRRRRRSA